MTVRRFTVHMVPVGKQRARTGKGFSYTPKKTTVAEQNVRDAYVAAHPDVPPFDADTPLYLYVVAYFPPPKAMMTKKRMPLIEKELLPHFKTPDWDNVGKLVSDALNGFCYHDDSRICEANVSKWYSLHPRLEVMVGERDREPRNP